MALINDPESKRELRELRDRALAYLPDSPRACLVRLRYLAEAMVFHAALERDRSLDGASYHDLAQSMKRSGGPARPWEMLDLDPTSKADLEDLSALTSLAAHDQGGGGFARPLGLALSKAERVYGAVVGGDEVVNWSERAPQSKAEPSSAKDLVESAKGLRDDEPVCVAFLRAAGERLCRDCWPHEAKPPAENAMLDELLQKLFEADGRIPNEVRALFNSFRHDANPAVHYKHGRTMEMHTGDMCLRTMSAVLYWCQHGTLPDSQFPVRVIAPNRLRVDGFQGRQRELDELFGEVRGWVRGTRGGLVSVVGDLGVGTSSLVHRFVELLESSEERLLDGIVLVRCWPNSLPKEVFKELQQYFASILNETRAKVGVGGTWGPVNRRLMIVLDDFHTLLDPDGMMHPDFSRMFGQVIEAEGGPLLVTTGATEPYAGVDPQRILRIGELSHADRVTLLRARVPGLSKFSDRDLEQVAEVYGGSPTVLLALARELGKEASPALGRVLQQHAAVKSRVATGAYGVLDPTQQVVLSALSVYQRPVPVSAIRPVVKAISPVSQNVREVLRRLSGHVTQFRSDGGADEYMINDLCRAVAYSKLRDDPEACESSHGAARRYYVEVLQRQEDAACAGQRELALFLEPMTMNRYLLWSQRHDRAGWREAYLESLHHFQHTGEASREEGRRELALLYFQSFFWWGVYVPLPFCDELLQRWAQIDARGNVWLDSVRTFHANYPPLWPRNVRDAVGSRLGERLQSVLGKARMREDQRGVTDPTRWTRVRRSLESLLKQVALEGEDGDSELSGYLWNYLADCECAAWWLCADAAKPGRERAAVEAYRKAYELIAPENNNDRAWMRYYLAEFLCHCGRTDEAAESDAECRRLLSEDLELPEGPELRTLGEVPNEAQRTSIVMQMNHELLANSERLRGELAWKRGEADDAATHYLRSVVHALAFNCYPHAQDEYTRALYIEMAYAACAKAVEAESASFAERLFALNRAYLGAAAEEAWTRVQEMLSAGVKQPAQFEALHDALFPPEPEDGELGQADTEYTERARECVREMGDEVIVQG